MIDNSLPIGSIVPYGGEILSSEVWKLCDGSSLSTTDYSELFAKIGYKFGGSGNLFKLPNQAEASFIGYSASGNIADTLGDTVGNNSHQITVNEMPSHNHVIYQNPNQSGSTKAGSGIFGTGGYNAQYADLDTYTQNSGGGQAMSLVQKSIVVNYIIKVSSIGTEMPSVQFNGTVNQIENTSNKVTEITEDSTDTQYPSAKSVAKLIQNSLLNEYINTLTTPATLADSNGGKLSNIDIVGKSIQNGTPTPTAPIEIQNVGNTLTLKSGVSADDTNATIYTIPLTDINGTSHIMRQFDEVKKHDDGKWYFDCNSNLVSFDGTESWMILDSSIGRFGIHILPQKEQFLNGFCNYYQVKKSLPYTNNSCYIGISNNVIYFIDSRYSTVDAFKEQLAAWNTAGNPLTVFYQTTTATSYELSTSTSAILDNIAIQKGNANIYFTNAVVPTMTADYPQDLQLYCKSLEARIEALENIQ